LLCLFDDALRLAENLPKVDESEEDGDSQNEEAEIVGDEARKSVSHDISRACKDIRHDEILRVTGGTSPPVTHYHVGAKNTRVLL